MKEHVSTARDGSGGRAKPALAVLTVAAIGLFFAAELAAPRDVPLGAAVLVPVLVSCFFLDRRLSVAILGLAVFTRAVVATVGDTSIGLAAIESASYIGSVAVALAHRRRAGFIPTRALVDDVVPSGSVPNISPASLEASGLTHRERQVLDMAMHGLTATQIGERLYIGRRTVETHFGRAYSKLGGRTKRELIARAFDDPERTATPPLPDASMRNP
jgi:DNA-binding CsgD family transcriptional regulator